MRKRLFRCILAAVLLSAVLPAQCFAVESSRASSRDGIVLETAGTNTANVTMDLPQDKGAGITAVRICFHIVPAVPGVKFEFASPNGSVSKDVVTAYRYHDETGELNVYAAGDRGLFEGAGEGKDISWKIGQVQIPKGERADISVDAGSTNLAYGDISSGFEEAGLAVSYPDGSRDPASEEPEAEEQIAADAGEASEPEMQAAQTEGTAADMADPAEDIQQETGESGDLPLLRWAAFIAVCAVGAFAVGIVISRSRKNMERRF